MIQPSKEIVPRPAATRRRGNGGIGSQAPPLRSGERAYCTNPICASRKKWKFVQTKANPAKAGDAKPRAYPGRNPYPSPQGSRLPTQHYLLRACTLKGGNFLCLKRREESASWPALWPLSCCFLWPPSAPWQQVARRKPRFLFHGQNLPAQFKVGLLTTWGIA